MLQNPNIRDYGCPSVTLTLIKAAVAQYTTKIKLFFSQFLIENLPPVMKRGKIPYEFDPMLIIRNQINQNLFTYTTGRLIR